MNQAAIIEYIKQLVSIPSTADNPEALHDAVDFVERLVNAHADVTIEHFEQNGKPSFLAYRGAVRPERFDVLLNAHLDVVPASDPSQFIPKVKGDKLYGRGAFDMKAAAIVEALAFCKMVHEVPYALGLQIVSDEETSGYDGARYQIEQGVRADFVLAGEHTLEPNVVYTKQRGLAWVEVSFSGKTAHGGYPWRGENALLQATSFAHKVLERYPIPNEQVWGTTANIASIETSNDTYNAVPDNAVVKVDFRFTSEDPAFRDRATIEALIHSFDAEAKVRDVPVFDGAIDVGSTNSYLQRLVETMENISGKPVRFERRYAGGDARHFAQVGANAVEFGLTGEHMHGSEEYVDLSAIPEYGEVLETFLRKVGDMNSLETANKVVSFSGRVPKRRESSHPVVKHVDKTPVDAVQ